MVTVDPAARFQVAYRQAAPLQVASDAGGDRSQDGVELGLGWRRHAAEVGPAALQRGGAVQAQHVEMVGFDRLVTVLLGLGTLQEVMSLPT